MSTTTNPAFERPSPPIHSPAARTLSGLLLGGSLLWCVYWFVHAWPFWEDDAWIHLEFARSLASGHGFSFNGHVVAGDTAPLWVFLLAAIHALVPDWLVAGKLVTIAGAIFGLGGVYAFARRLAAGMLPAREAAVFPAAMLLLIVLNPNTCYWIFSGMEPIAAAGLACWAVLAATSERPTATSFLAGCLLAGLGPLLRPEMTFLAILLALPLLGVWRRLPAGSMAKPGLFVAGLLLLAVPLMLWSLYSLHAFGHLLPNTNAAKRAGPNESVVRRLASIYLSGWPVIAAGLVAGIASLLLRASAVTRSIRSALLSAFRGTQSVSDRSAVPLAGWLFLLWASTAAVFYLVNHTYVQTRYILISSPGLTIVLLALALRSSARAGRVIYGLALASALMLSVITVVPLVRNKGINCQASHQIARYMHDRLPPDAPVAVYSIGQIAFESEHPIIDTGGITRPGAIPYLNEPLSAMAQWAQSQGAQYYIEAHSPLPGSISVYAVDMPFVGWTLHPAQYANYVRVSVWKLPPDPSRQANSSPAGRP